MKDLFSSVPDNATPINSNGGRGNASGGFNISRKLSRKPANRQKRKSPPLDKSPDLYDSGDTGSMDRNFGSFSLESKRHVWDLLNKHPKFGSKDKVQMNRIENNTREVLKNDPLKLIENGGKVNYLSP